MSVRSEISSDIQNALNAIEKQYQQLDDWLEQMHDDTKAIQKDKSDIEHKAIHHHRTNWGLFHTHYTTVNTKLEKSLNKDIEAKTKDLSTLADEIDSANHAAYGDLATAIRTLTSGIESTIANNGGQKGTASYVDSRAVKRMADDIAEVVKDLDAVVKALGLKVAEQEVEAEVAVLQKDGGSPQDIQKLIQESIGLSGQESLVLTDLDDQLTGDFNEFLTKYRKADANQSSIHWVQEFFGNGIDRKEQDKEIKKNAQKMIDLIGALKNAIAPEKTKIDPSFQAIVATLDDLVKKLAELLTSTSPEDQKTMLMSLNEAIMNIFVMIVGILGVVQQESAKDKAKSEEIMSKGSVESAQEGVANAQLSIKKLESALKYARMMGKLMEACKYTMMAIGTVVVPGYGAMLVGMLMIALEASGVMDKLRDACASKLHMGQLGAECFIGGLEIVTVCGGGLLIEEAADTAMETAIETVNVIVARLIAQAVEKSVSEIAVKAADEAAAAAMRPVLEMAVNSAVETAMKKTFTMYFQKNGVQLAIETIQSAVKGGVKGCVARMAQEVMEKAATEAANTSAQEMSNLLVLFGKQTAADLTVEETTMMKALTEEVANAAAANAMNVSVKTAEKVAVNQSRWITSGWRGLATGAYALGSNNILVDSAQAAQKKWHKMSDKEFEKLKLGLLALEQLVAALAQMFGSGAASQFMNASSSSKLAVIMKVTNALQLIPTAANGAADYGMYEALQAQGEANTDLGKIQTVLNTIFQMAMPEIEARKKQESDHDTKIFMSMMKSTVALAGNSYRNLDYSAEALRG